MKYDKDTKKLTYEMKSPGESWMGHVEQTNGASAYNPITVEGGQQSKWTAQMQERMNQIDKKVDDISKAQSKQKNISDDLTPGK